MRRSIVFGLSVVLLAGCATFSTPDAESSDGFPYHDTTPVSVQQMQLLVPGDWYAVRLPEKEGSSSGVRGVFSNGFVGRLQESDDNSLTLTDVAKCTSFDSTSSLRRLPLLGSNFENGWTNCKNQRGTVTVSRSNIMWFEPISAEKADRIRRFDEISRTPMIANIDVGEELPSPMPNVDFLLANPRSEEIRSQRWLEVRQMKPGQWYNVIVTPGLKDRPGTIKVHVGLVDHLDSSAVKLTDVTTGSLSINGPGGSQASSEMTLRYSEIDRVIPLSAEEAAEQVEAFNRPRDSVTADDLF